MQTIREKLRDAIAAVATAREQLSQAEKSLARGTTYLENARAAHARHVGLSDRLAQHYADAIERGASTELPEHLRTLKLSAHEAAADVGVAEQALPRLQAKVEVARGELARALTTRDQAACDVFYNELTPIAENLAAINAERRRLQSLLGCALNLPIGPLATGLPRELQIAVNEVSVAVKDDHSEPSYFPERPNPNIPHLRSFYEALRDDSAARFKESEDTRAAVAAGQ